MSDRIAVMNHGRIEQAGPPHRLYQAPANDFVAEFLGESNLFEATIVGRRDDGWVAETAKKMRFFLEPREGLAVGQPVRITLRPENIVLDDGAGLSSTYSGIVEDRIYIGGYTKFSVRLTESDETVTFVRLNRSGLPEIRRGDRVTLGWHAGDAQVVLSAGGTGGRSWR